MALFRRNQVSSQELRNGEYTQLNQNDTWCVCRCPNCGRTMQIIKQYHSISYMGESNPKVVCPAKCGFSEVITLEDWIPEAKGNA